MSEGKCDLQPLSFALQASAALTFVAISCELARPVDKATARENRTTAMHRIGHTVELSCSENDA